MTYFDMTLKQACSAFGIALNWLRKIVTYGGPIGHCRQGGVVKKITSLDLVAHLAQLREREAAAGGMAGGEGE